MCSNSTSETGGGTVQINGQVIQPTTNNRRTATLLIKSEN